jgi:AbiV family abortive infection protein
MTPEETQRQLRAVREACLANAEAFLSMAERELGKGVDHICFHLALLALEEIGKSILATISYMTTTAGSERAGLVGAMDDHTKKIFWALWGAMLRNTRFTKEDIEQNRDLARSLHGRRLESLYTDPNEPIPVDERIEQSEARMITELTRARLELERTQEIVDLEEGDIKDITWFFTAIDDFEKRKQIFGHTSLGKLATASNGKEWIKWLRDLDRKNEDEMRKYAERELNRPKPEAGDRLTPKYRLTIRIQTPSHSIRNNAFTKWNEGVDGIKIRKSDRKDATRITKGEILLDFTFPKSLHASYLWEHGFFMSKTIVIALNVGTLGFFWWHVGKDVATFYEEIVDLEADPKGSVRLVVAPPKRLVVDFDPARLVLNEEVMRNVNLIAALLMREHQKLERFLGAYATGLTLFSKTDVHLRLEVNAFGEFHNALKEAMRALGDWDGLSDFAEAARRAYEALPEKNDLNKTLDLGAALEADVKREKYHPITLTEVVGMKMYCDYYLQRKAREYFERLSEDSDKMPGATA